MWDGTQYPPPGTNEVFNGVICRMRVGPSKISGRGTFLVKGTLKKNVASEAYKKFYMHKTGHWIGLDVHDVGFTTEPFAPGWVLTVEPGIYIPKEGFAVRLENDIVVTPEGPVDLMAGTPVEAEEIEELMAK